MGDFLPSLVKCLKEEEFIIQRYDSYSTNSIYLKLDYGVCNSIRISDHRGKKHLQYRYNVLKNQKSIYRGKSPQGWDRNYYGFQDIETLLQDILKDRDNKISRWGDRYAKYMEKNKNQEKDKPGFWSQCVEI